MMAGKDSLAKLDIGVLSAEQQEKLRQYKIQTKIDNEKYLKSHPEVEILIGDFLRDVLLKRPHDIHEFAADHFTNPNLHTTIGSKVEGNCDTE
ncbi:RIIa domain-containing protein 1 [Anabas testudineus]|uniref:RIIa domain-containing protein n=1 Tax=Anabas testudineus TaxID=64144 RepID=A0A7N6A2B6_ANATE|nr:RIIa domain-containing protein 1 [Anabas testudineus]